MMKHIKKPLFPIDLYNFQIKQGDGAGERDSRIFPGILFKIFPRIETDSFIILPLVLFHPLGFCSFIKRKPEGIIDPDNSIDCCIQFFHAVPAAKKCRAADVGDGAAYYLFGIENTFLCLCKLHKCSI